MAKFTVLMFDWDTMRDGDGRVLRWKIADGDFSVIMKALTMGQIMTPYHLEADNMDKVFETLNINHPDDYQRRSLSVGDLIISNDEVFQVTSLGFQRVDSRIERRISLILEDLQYVSINQLRKEGSTYYLK
jgi:hypothetical protein